MFATQLWHHVKIQKCFTPLWSTSQLILMWAASHFISSQPRGLSIQCMYCCLTYIPSSLTQYKPVTYIPTEHISNHSSPPPVLSMDLGMVAGQFKVWQSQLYIACSPLIVYEFLCFKIKTKSRVATCTCHAKQLPTPPSYWVWEFFNCEMYQGGIVGVCPLFQWV